MPKQSNHPWNNLKVWNPTYEMLHRWWCVEKLSLKQIAERAGVSSRVVSDKLAKHKIRDQVPRPNRRKNLMKPEIAFAHAFTNTVNSIEQNFSNGATVSVSMGNRGDVLKAAGEHMKKEGWNVDFLESIAPGEDYRAFLVVRLPVKENSVAPEQ